VIAWCMALGDALYHLPLDLPVPEDDGACAHLPGRALLHHLLPATNGETVDLAALPGRTVVYIYPRTGRPDEPLLPGWDAIPGARGCTPQSCAFRDHHAEIEALGARVFGLSAQSPEAQHEVVDRLHLPYPLLSDADLQLARSLDLPTFKVAGMALYKRVTLLLRDGVIEDVMYPVFPPDANAEEVVKLLQQRP
jgi:peroxiredoxin